MPRPPVNAAAERRALRPGRGAVRPLHGPGDEQRHEPCIDELEVFTAGPAPRNVALAVARARRRRRRATARLPTSTSSSTSTTASTATAAAGSPTSAAAAGCSSNCRRPAAIDRVVWGRDREGKIHRPAADALPRSRSPTEPGEWQRGRLLGRPRAVGRRGATAGARRPTARDTAAGDCGKAGGAGRGCSAGTAGRRMVYAGRSRRRSRPSACTAAIRCSRASRSPRRLRAVRAAALDWPPTRPEQQRRLALADWITDPTNPLTARVLVNRLWQYHFGTGIVDTPSDFGRNGSPPTHPELLDWLAGEFVGRRLVAQAHPPADRPVGDLPAVAAPPARGRAVDAAVAAAVALPAAAAGGGADPRRASSRQRQARPAHGRPGLRPVRAEQQLRARSTARRRSSAPPEWRRMVYQHKPRMQLDDVFGAFDCPDAGQIAPGGPRSTTPLQALNLLNSPFMLQQAELFADARRNAKRAPDPTAQVRAAFRLAFSRDPDAGRARGVARGWSGEHGLATLSAGRCSMRTNSCSCPESTRRLDPTPGSDEARCSTDSHSRAAICSTAATSSRHAGTGLGAIALASLLPSRVPARRRGSAGPDPAGDRPGTAPLAPRPPHFAPQGQARAA